MIIELDEFQPWPGLACYVYGRAWISYTWVFPDTSTGFRGGPEDITLDCLVIDGHTGEEETIAPDHPLFKAVAAAISDDDYIARMCCDDYMA